MALRKKFLRRIIYSLRKGITPHKLALSVSIGITIGILPIYGITSILITLIALIFRLNFTASQVAHYAVFPLQLLLIFPFLKLGNMIFGHTLLPRSVEQLLFMMKTDFWGTMHNFWIAYLTAAVIWFIVSIPLSVLLYRVLFIYFKRLAPVTAK
ncbi:MAG: DUF2062 domain-containing protein [Bacteroidales bacterium]|nr:DUF2062 domain-containing protein [Bacteroidales bacterium]